MLYTFLQRRVVSTGLPEYITGARLFLPPPIPCVYRTHNGGQAAAGGGGVPHRRMRILKRDHQTQETDRPDDGEVVIEVYENYRSRTGYLSL